MEACQDHVGSALRETRLSLDPIMTSCHGLLEPLLEHFVSRQSGSESGSESGEESQVSDQQGNEETAGISGDETDGPAMEDVAEDASGAGEVGESEDES